MLKKFYISFMFLNLIVLNSQAQNFKSKLRVDYEMTTLFDGMPENYKSTLYINEMQSKFIFKIQDSLKVEDSNIEELDGNNYKFSVKVKDTAQNIIYLQKKNNILYTVISNKGNQLALYEEIPVLDWKLSPNEKRIGNFRCKKATASFRGRNYTAWYTESIPSSFGPWKLNGLSGLILEAYDDKKEVFFSVIRLIMPFSENIQGLSNAIEKMSRKESKKIAEKNAIELKRKLQSLGSRDVKINIGDVKINGGIELD